MSKKFKLFASVAGPVLTLPLLMQPAAALPLAPAVQNGARANIVEVQAQVIVPPNGQGAEEGEGQQRPRRHQQDQGQGGAEQGGQQRPPRQQGTDAEGGQPQRPQRQQGGDTEGGQQRPPRQMQGQGQAQPGEEGGAQRPARQQQSDEGSGQQQRPPRQQQADQPAVRPQAEAPAQKPADNPAPHAPAPHAPAPQAEQPKPKPQSSQSAEPQQQPAARPAQAPQEPASQAPQPAPQHAAPAGAAPKPPVAQKAEPATPAPKPPAQADAPQQRPAEPQAQPGQPKPEAAPQTEPRTTPKTQAQQPAGEAPAGRPQGQPAQQPAQARPTTPPAGEAPANAPAAAPGSNQAGSPPQRPGAQPTSPPGGTAPQGHSPNPVPGQAPGQGSGQAQGQPQGVPQGQAPGQPQGQIPGRAPSQTPGQAQGQPPVQQNGVAPNATQPNAAQQAGAVQQPPPPAVTPQQVERAKELAKDPSAAKPGEQLVLPVENGAAVLDSAKQPMQMRPQRGGPQGGPQGGQQAGSQGGPQGGAQGGPAGNGPNGRPFPPQDAGMPVAPPRSDADAQVGTRETRQQQQQFQALDQERGQRLGERPQFDRPRGWDFDPSYAPPQGRDRDDHRVIITIDNQPVVRHDDSRRFYEDGGSQPEYDQLRDGRVREVITRDDGTRIVTIRNRYGEVIQRSRVVRGGQEYVLYYAPDLMNQDRSQNYQWRDPGDDLPPMRLSVPVDDYIIDTSSQPNRDYYRFLEQPPVERVERVYSLDEVRYSARIRDKVRRIDLDTITFATGSADVPMNQAGSLRRVADAIKEVLGRDPSETFLIEGHTDAVGSAQSNLILSDQRAESVAQVLTSAFGIPPENLATQGYGEQFLKVRTDGPSQENRRVTIRRITALVKPVASNR